VKGEIIFNGDFALLDSASGVPMGWTFGADGTAGTTSVVTDTVNGVSKNVVRLNRTANGGGGAGFLQRIVSRHFHGRTRHHPSTLIEFPALMAVTLTHKMTNIAHAGVANFLGAASSFYYNDEAFNGLNLSRSDYYAGWGPTGVVGGQGATGGLGSTSGYITETRLVPFVPHYLVAYADLNFVEHDDDIIGEWRISKISARAA
jgi:hypothetical protein